MLQVSDNKIWQITRLLYNAFHYDDQVQRLDRDNLKEFKKENIKPLYPHKIGTSGIEKYSCGEACCIVDPGNFCCCNTNQPDSSFRKIGLGLCLYFKFMKHAAIVFTVIAFLTIISCLICFLVSSENGFNTTADYQTFLFSTTLGTFSSEHNKCQYEKIQNGSSSVAFTIQCPYGRVSGFGATYSNQSLNTLYNCKNQIKKYQSSDPTYSVASNQISCNNQKSSCSFNVTSVNQSAGFTTIAYSYECLDQVYSLGLYQIKSQYLFYIVIAIDFLCCIILILFYCSEGKAEQQEITFFKQSQLSLNDFSLKIKGLNITTFDEEFNVIVRSLTKLLGEELPGEIVQVKTPDRIDFVQYQNKKNEAYKQLYQFIGEEFFDHEVNPSIFKDPQDFIDRNFQKDAYPKYKEKLVKLISEFHFLQYEANEERANKICSIFIVLNTIGMKNRIYEAQKDGCFSRYYQFGDKEYVLSEPPSPDLIIWKNKGRWTFLRVIISWILTLAICMGSYMLFGFIQYEQTSYLSTYNFNINCNVLYNSSQLASYLPIAGDSNYLTCYCMQNLLSLQSQCVDFQKTYITYLAIPVIISILLVVYNVIVSTFFRLLTKLESHRLITAELFSYTVKRAFLLIMNMALIMIILNMKYSSGLDMNQFSFLLQGKYNDLTPDWYINIGAIIILTMIFNITFPIIELFLANILKCIRKCWDKKCCCRATSCKTKSEYVELYSNDIYPIQERYAFLISVFLITLTFSCVIPILNFICAVSLLLLYYADRLLVFKVYQTPVNYGPELHKLISKTIYLALISHFALSALFLSESNLIAPATTISQSYQLNSSNTRINSMVTVYYIIPYVIMFLLFAGWAVFENTLIAFCEKCMSLCKKNLSHITKYKLEQNLYDILSPYQLGKVKMMIEGQLSKLTAKENAYKSIRKNKSFTMNDSMKGLSLQFNIQTNQSSEVPANEHDALLRRTLMKLRAEETLRKREKEFGDMYLIGLPSYEIMVNDDAFEQNRKNNMLSSALGDLLKDVLEGLNQ